MSANTVGAGGSASEYRLGLALRPIPLAAAPIGSRQDAEMTIDASGYLVRVPLPIARLSISLSRALTEDFGQPRAFVERLVEGGASRVSFVPGFEGRAVEYHLAEAEIDHTVDRR